MRTNNVPALIMLLAGAVECVAAIVTHQTLWAFTKKLFLVLIIFYILGSIVKMILDRNFSGDDDDFEEVELGEEVKQPEEGEQKEQETEQTDNHEETEDTQESQEQ